MSIYEIYIGLDPIHCTTSDAHILWIFFEKLIATPETSLNNQCLSLFIDLSFINISSFAAFSYMAKASTRNIATANTHEHTQSPL